MFPCTVFFPCHQVSAKMLQSKFNALKPESQLITIRSDEILTYQYESAYKYNVNHKTDQWSSKHKSDDIAYLTASCRCDRTHIKVHVHACH